MDERLSPGPTRRAPCAPYSPRGFLVHLCRAQLLRCDLLLQTNPLILLILRFLTYIERVLFRIGEYVIERPVTVNRRDFVSRERVEMRLPFRRAGGDHFEACSRQQILPIGGRGASRLPRPGVRRPMLSNVLKFFIRITFLLLVSFPFPVPDGVPRITTLDDP